MATVKEQLSVLISELEAFERSMSWKMNGYEQEVMGKKHFCCLICGHCPAALIERLKQIK